MKQDHPPECKWHKDWHACDCGLFDKENEEMKNPCNEICIGKVDDVVEWWQVNSYNAGYHRGLNTEYHDIPINILFTKWIADVRRPVSEALDIVAFEKGFRDGIEDYEDSLKEFGDGAATTAGWEE